MDPSSQHAQMRHTFNAHRTRRREKRNHMVHATASHIGDRETCGTRQTSCVRKHSSLPSAGLAWAFNLRVTCVNAYSICRPSLCDSASGGAGLGLQTFGTSHFTPGEGGDGKGDMAIGARGQPLRWPRLDPQRGGCWNRLRGYSGRRGRCWCFKCIAAACAVSALSPGCVL